ncbi:MAG: hypothetical protein AAFT19_03885 [Pseudomonadota bacterium]
MSTGGILISIAVAAFVALQAAKAGAEMRIVVPVAAAAAGVMAGFWALAMGTLFPRPDLWETLPLDVLLNAVVAAIGGAGFVFAGTRLIEKIRKFREKYPDR